MKKHQLISMTSYVLKMHENWNNNNTQYMNLSAFHSFCLCYSRFLKTPLELGQFVPCDEDGTVRSEPNKDHIYYRIAKGIAKKYFKDCEKYQQAKERVIFEGFERMDEVLRFLLDEYKTIEGLVNHKRNLTLTSSKAKSLGL